MDDKSFYNFLNELEKIYIKDNEESSDVEMNDKKTIISQKTVDSVFDFTVGIDENDNKITCDITSAPHVLICGENTDKIIKNVVLELVKQNNFKLALFGNEEVYSCFKSLPHLMHEITFDDKKIEGVLRYLINEMENRFQLFEDSCTRNIREYTKKTSNIMPYIIVVIDGYERLKLYNNKIVAYLLSLIQKARAAGIHIILGVNNVTSKTLDGYLFNNVPTRIVSKVKDKNASIAAIFCNGAQNLENDKLMFLGVGDTQPKTLSYSSEADEKEVLKDINGTFVKDENLENFVLEYAKNIKVPTEDLIAKAKEVVNQLDSFFAVTFQKQMKIGYNKARLILAELERDGYIYREEVGQPYKKIK